MVTRCKFVCNSVEKRTASPPYDFVYEANFSAVYSGSEENKKFFAFAPSGQLSVGQYKEDLFQPGKHYFIDISEADQS